LTTPRTAFVRAKLNNVDNNNNLNKFIMLQPLDDNQKVTTLTSGDSKIANGQVNSGNTTGLLIVASSMQTQNNINTTTAKNATENVTSNSTTPTTTKDSSSPVHVNALKIFIDESNPVSGEDEEPSITIKSNTTQTKEGDNIDHGDASLVSKSIMTSVSHGSTSNTSVSQRRSISLSTELNKKNSSITSESKKHMLNSMRKHSPNQENSYDDHDEKLEYTNHVSFNQQSIESNHQLVDSHKYDFTSHPSQKVTLRKLTVNKLNKTIYILLILAFIIMFAWYFIDYFLKRSK
jgi:hypothetical protein